MPGRRNPRSARLACRGQEEEGQGGKSNKRIRQSFCGTCYHVRGGPYRHRLGERDHGVPQEIHGRWR